MDGDLRCTPRLPVFRGLPGAHRLHSAGAERLDLLRALVFIGARSGCPEAFSSRASFGGPAGVNLLACVCAGVLPFVGTGRRQGLAAALLLAVPFLAESVLSTFGILIGPALAD